MKRLLPIISILVLLAMVAACAPKATEAPPAVEPTAIVEPIEAPKAFKVGLLSPGPVNDQGWAQVAYEGLLIMEKDYGAEISYVELGESPSDFEKAFRDYASQGYDLVWGHGFQFQDPAVTVAVDYPDTIFFVSSSYYYEGTNVYGVNTNNTEAFFPLGVIAGLNGDMGGYVGGVDIPPIKDGEIGFISGALYANPDFKTSVTYLGNWTDVAAAKEAAMGMIDEGATFVCPNANIAGNGVYQAAVEKDVWAFGTFGNQNAQAPEHIVANYILSFGRGVADVAATIKDGTFDQKSNILFTLASKGVIAYEYNPDAKFKLSQETLDAVDKAIQGIIAGEIDAGASSY